MLVSMLPTNALRRLLLSGTAVVLHRRRYFALRKTANAPSARKIVGTALSDNAGMSVARCLPVLTILIRRDSGRRKIRGPYANVPSYYPCCDIHIHIHYGSTHTSIYRPTMLFHRRRR